MLKATRKLTVDMAGRVGVADWVNDSLASADTDSAYVGGVGSPTMKEPLGGQCDSVARGG